MSNELKFYSGNDATNGNGVNCQSAANTQPSSRANAGNASRCSASGSAVSNGKETRRSSKRWSELRAFVRAGLSYICRSRTNRFTSRVLWIILQHVSVTSTFPKQHTIFIRVRFLFLYNFPVLHKMADWTRWTWSFWAVNDLDNKFQTCTEVSNCKLEIPFSFIWTFFKK